MFAKYTYNPLSSTVDLFNDFKSIITGNTDKNILSNSCDKVNSYINSTELAGWAYTATGLVDIFDKDTTLSIGTVYDVVYVGDTINKYIAIGSTGIATSTNRKSWTTVSSATNVYAIAYNGSILLAVSTTTSLATCYYSSNGTSWTAGGTYAYSSGSIPFTIGVKGSKFYLVNPNANLSNIWTTTDGVTITSVSTGGTSDTVYGVTSNGSITIVYGNSYLKTSTDDITWTSRTTLFSTLFNCVWMTDKFMMINSSGSNVQTSPDGITWTLKNNLVTGSSSYPKLIPIDSNSCVVVGNNGIAQTTNSGSNWIIRKVTWAKYAGCRNGNDFLFISETNALLAEANKLNGLFTSPCVNGLRQKYAFIEFLPHIAITGGSPFVIAVYESFNIGTWGTNVCYSTDEYTVNVPQRFDITGGGFLLIGATNRYLCVFSYLQAANSWGNSAGHPMIMLEFQSEDLWNQNNEYPTVLVSHGHQSSGNYNETNFNSVYSEFLVSPRYKYSSTTDSTYANYTSTYITSTPQYAFKIKYGAISNNKTALDALGVPYYPTQDIHVFNPNGTIYVHGGLVLGGLKMGGSSVGANTDEYQINGQNYMIWYGIGAKWLIPKF